MEEEERNPKPKQTNSNTPAIVLAILFGIVVLLLYAGWNLMSDDASNITDMKTVEKTTDTDVIGESSTPIVEDREDLDKEIVEKEEAVEAQTMTTPAPVVESKSEPEKKEAPKSSYSGETAMHTVKSGETFFAIANKFNTSQDQLKALNPDLNPNNIKVGVTKIKVPVQAVHTVGPGDILRVVAGKYNVSVDALMAANGKTKNHAARGEKLLIPIK